MKQLLSTKNVLLIALCFAVTNPSVYAKGMYKWVDKNGKVSFSDQVPPSKAELGHQELNKNAQVVKVTEKAKTKAELEIDKRLMQLKKRQEEIVLKQKSYDKKLLSGFRDLAAMDSTHKTKIQALNTQEQNLQAEIKKSEAELAAQQKEAASYEVKNQKIPADTLKKIEETRKKITQSQQNLKELQEKKAVTEKELASDRARYVFLTTAKSKSDASEPIDNADKSVEQLGLFNCSDAQQCEKAWSIAKEFVKTNSVAKISIDTDILFMSEDPLTDNDMNLAASKIISEKKTPQIFLDIRCTEAGTAKGVCSGSKADSIRTQFTDYIKTNLNSAAAPAVAPVAATPKPAAAVK